jgi:membrane-bound inhibitor of C-type lysozyme
MEAVAALSLAAMLGGGADTSVQLILELPGNVERNVVQYDCAGEPLTVEYINAAPTFLALLDAGNGKTIFVNVMSGSGARYASGQYEWWTEGSEATFTDLTKTEGEQGAISCLEFNQTP